MLIMNIRTLSILMVLAPKMNFEQHLKFNFKSLLEIITLNAEILAGYACKLRV